MASLLVPVSPGELLDKISILRLKSDRLTDAAGRANVARELAALEHVAATGVPDSPELDALTAELADINSRLWHIEDALRSHEAAQDFGAAFVELARQVYLCNDRRAALKRQMNLLLSSDLLEEKEHQIVLPDTLPKV